MAADFAPWFRDRALDADHCIDLLEKMGVAAFAVDRECRIYAANHKTGALLGLSTGEIIGSHCHDVFSGVPCRYPCPCSMEWNAPRESGNIPVVDAHQTPHTVTRLYSPLFGEDGRIVGRLIILQENFPLANLVNWLHHEEKSLKLILDHLDLAICTVNRSGLITFFNSAAESLTGFDRKRMIGNPLQTLLGPNEADIREDLDRTMNDGRPRACGAFRILGRMDERIEVKADFFPISNNLGKIVEGLITFRDLTLARRLDEVSRRRFSYCDMIGRDPSMQRLFELVRRVAPSETTVLIEGETGTGKDVFARAIHESSNRSEKPFVKVNCAAFPENLLESEMFGYAKGAFTGADRDKPGRFNEADGGTIFLDEIGDLPLCLQAKLLRVLEDREFYALGSARTTRVDVRIIAATNRGLKSLIRKRLFREDLFYRLNVFSIEIPRLRDRPADLPLLIRHFLRRLSAAQDRRIPEVSEDAMSALLAYEYPGNIRELENILEYALLTCSGAAIRAAHLHSYVLARSEMKRRNAPLAPEADGERARILDALEKCRWNRTETAGLLGINRSTLWRKMRKYLLTR